MPDFDRVAPTAPVADITKAKIAIVTSGGIVPKGNPDSMKLLSAQKYGKYDIEGLMDLTSVKLMKQLMVDMIQYMLMKTQIELFQLMY